MLELEDLSSLIEDENVDAGNESYKQEETNSDDISRAMNQLSWPI